MSITGQRITFIGSGNVASHLSLVLRQKGNTITQVWSRQYAHAEKLAGLVGAKATDKWSNLSLETDVVIIAITDDALYQFPKELHFDNALVLHTSGCVPIEVLRTVSESYGVLWSPQSFILDATMDYAELPFCIEGNTPASEAAIRHLIEPVSEHIYPMNSTQRQWAHLCAVMANNFGNALNATAEALMQQQQIPFEILHPIIALTCQKAQKGSLWHQQTGPAARGDEKTLEAHRQLLKEQPLLLELYNLMTRIIQDGTH